MLLPRIGCIFQRARPRYHRILETSTALIKREMRHSSSCLGIGRHLKLLCACAYVATRGTAMATSLVPRLVLATGTRSTLRESGDETNGFPPGNEAEDRQLANGFLRRESTSALVYATSGWSKSNSSELSGGSGCVDLSVFRVHKGQKKYPQK